MTNALLDAALKYAERGWPVFPCRADKAPLTENGVLDATTNPDTIRAWWLAHPKANIGMDVGAAGLMVLDLDPGHNRNALAIAVGGLPDTPLRQRSPRGGEHLFYALADREIVAPSSNKVAPHVDVRSFHSYVLLAPSRTMDGTYTWEGEGKPAYRTDEMVRVANVAKEKSKDRDNWIIEPDLPENVASAVAWLKNDAKIAVEGHGGDHTAYATAAMLKSYGISEPLAFDLIWEHWNPRCRPPWSADEADHLEAKVRNGYAYNTSAPGNCTPAYRVAKTRTLFQPVKVELPSGREVNAGRFRFVDRAGLDHVRQPEWLVHDFIPQQGYALLIGARGTFKTFVALDVALSVATGANFPWVGPWSRIVAPGPVLFAVGEGRSGIKQRQEAWEKLHFNGKPATGMILADPVPHISEDPQPFIDGALSLNPDGYALCVLDTVGRSMQGTNENAQEHASAFTRLVETLQRSLGCAVLALHHTGHEAGSRARGSSVFEADPDTVVRLDREGKDPTIKLTMTKQKDAPEWERPRYVRMTEVKLDDKRVSLVPMLVTEEPKPTPSQSARRAQGVNDEATLKIVDDALSEVLNMNSLRAWTTQMLAETVAMRENIEISSRILTTRTFPALREKTGTAASRCYDPTTRRWRWKA